jgi:succinyl-CoA synthetase beta subunit
MENDISQVTGMVSGAGLSMTTVGIVTSSTGTTVNRVKIKDRSRIVSGTASNHYD